MYAPSKSKESRKCKEKTRRLSIEDGIPEVPQISDFQLTDSLESSKNETEIKNEVSCHLTEKVENFHLVKKKNEEEKEKIVFESNSVTEAHSFECHTLQEDKKESEPKSIKFHFSEESVDNGVSHNSVSESETEFKLTCDIPQLEKFENDSLKIGDYCNLATKVKAYSEEINRPSAPTAEGSLISQTPPALHLPEETSTSIEKQINISNYNFSITLQDILPALSDEKLKEYYFNPELQESKTYARDFINQEINNETKKDNKLYRLLVEYVKAKNRLKTSETKIKDLKESLNTNVSALWTVWNNVKITEKEKCSDGNVVTFVEQYTQAHFNVNIFKEISSIFTQIKNETYEAHITDSLACSALKSKIEYFLQSLLTSCPEFTNLEEESSASLSASSKNSHFQQCLLELKVAISILFMFQRKQSLEVDSSFLVETRNWLSDLIAILLRVGDWKDHIFILHHIMRCPGGVSEWAAHFVQLPFSNICVDPFKNFELNHMMTVMSILLSPIEQRENFIKKWESELSSDVNPWIVIDSDGEVEDDDQHSCPLKENDLVLLLNQIPFGHLFKAVLKCDGSEITSSFLTLDYVLKLFSFLTEFIKILLSGLKLYSTERYKQFTKRLGRLIYHIVQYATDALIIVKSQKLCESELTRIQVEYDNFFLRSTKFIYSAKKHGTWQFLATIPYHTASSNAVLKLYGILQLNDLEDDSIVKVDFSKFVENFLLLPEEEQFYLLTTFANMALARDIVEIQFIKNIVLQLLFIGFLNPSTMDNCYKNVRSLLCSICSAHPFLMSEILCIQNNTFLTEPDNDQKLTLNLWAKLQVDIWQPKKRDLETLGTWLLEPINSVRNELARLIIQSLNYGVNQGDLFLPAQNHYIIALIILQANVKLVLGNEAGVIKTVSNLVLYQSPDQSINDWTWNVLLKLRLHLLDKSDAEMCRCFYNLAQCLQNIPDVEKNIELHNLVLKRYPVACYIALMTTTLGHSVPLIYDKGFELVEVLFNVGKYEPGLACLEFMTLLFLDCTDSLHKCEKFITLLSRLIAADKSYVQFAKNLISYDFPGPVLKCVESMMQHQLNRWRGLNFNNFSSVVQLWMISLTKIPLWKQEPGILYLIDKLVENSFFDSASSKTITAILNDLLEAESPPSETKSFSLVGWMNSKYSPPSLLPRGFNGEVPWFSYQVIRMEFETYEKRSSVWIELLKELHSYGDKKINVDNSLKKICNFLKIPVRTSSVLAIYKWSYQILETDISHPLIPLIWQRFFFLYFYRVPGLTDRGSIGGKFFDGVINQSLFKRLKARLQETCDYYKSHSENADETKGREHYSKCYNLFQTFSVWLYDTNLHKPCLSLHMLPIQYNPELLGLLIHESETPWIEYLEYQNIEKNFKNGTNTWLRLKNRVGSGNRSRIMSYKKEKSLKEKLKERLNSYENPLPPPRIDSRKYKFPRINLDIMTNAEKMILFVKPLLQVLLDFVKQYTYGINEYISLGMNMQELLPRLYITVDSQKLLKGHCSGVNKVVNGKNVVYSCSGPAVIKLTYQESKLNEQVNQHLGRCEVNLEQNLKKAMASIPTNLTSAAVLIDIAIEKLSQEYYLSSYRSDEDEIVSKLKETGVHLFYELVRIWRERIIHMPPLNLPFENYVDVLGKCFIEGNAEENDRILHMMFGNDLFDDKLCKYFTPNASSTYDFIANYSKVLDFVSENKYVILSKFDLNLWLVEKKPKFSERSRMISTVGRGIKSIKEAEDQNILKLLNQHLEILLMYDFPEHYGEVLNFLLQASESQSLFTSTWFAFLNALASGHFAFVEGRTDKNIFEPGQSVKKLKYYFGKFAAEQKLISFDVVQGTIILLASTFKTERFKVGTHGLYRKYRLYIEPIFIFFGMLSYSSVTKAVEIDKGSLSDKLAQQLWPLLSDLYSPWLVPYCVDNQKEPILQAIQEQNFEHSVLLPWILNDSCHASFGASVFAESVRFLFDALPGLNHVLSYTWYFYVSNFAHIYVKDYILNVIHESLLSIPWETFFPKLQDVELMLKVVDQFLPLSHSFLGSIFVNIKWTELVHYYLSVSDLETTTKLHICLLHLLVKLPLEPSLKQNEKVLALLTEANGYAWHLLDSVSYESVLNWFILSCDPRIILMDERLDYYKLDSTILRLLQICAGYVPFVKSFHPTTLSKRLMFVRTCVKWLVTSNRRFKLKDSLLFKTTLTTMWSDMETVITESELTAVPQNQQVEEAAILLSEFLAIFSEADLCSVVERTFSEWLSTRKAQVIVFGLFRSAGASIENFQILGSIMESAIDNYFTYTENCNWNEVTINIVICPKPNLEGRLEKTLIDNKYFLTLYTALLKNESRKTDFSSKVVLTDLLQLLAEVKLSSNIEPKLILLIAFGLQLAETEIKVNVKEGIFYLVRFSNALNNFINDKGNGIFSAIGLKKSGSSNRFKLVCLVVCSGIVVFLKNNYPEYQGSADEKILQALALAENNKLYQNIQEYATYAKTAVKEISTIGQIVNLLKHIGFKLFDKLYLN